MPINILIADDSDIIRQTIGLIFKGENYTISSAENGSVALDKLKEKKIDLAFIDLNLPEKNGYELSQIIRKDNLLSNIPIVVMGEVSEGNIDNFKNIGASIISKPFKSEEILNLVNSIFNEPKEEIIMGEEIVEEVVEESNASEDNFISDIEPVKSSNEFTMDNSQEVSDFEFNIPENNEEKNIRTEFNQEFESNIEPKENKISDFEVIKEKEEISDEELSEYLFSGIKEFKEEEKKTELEPEKEKEEVPSAEGLISEEKLTNLIENSIRPILEKHLSNIIPDLVEKIIKEKIDILLKEKEENSK